MALKASHHRPVVLAQTAASTSTIHMMRTTLADMRATTERTIALIDATWAVLVAADDLLAQPISSAPQRRKADATRRRFERTVGDHSQTTTGAPSSSASRILT